MKLTKEEFNKEVDKAKRRLIFILAAGIGVSIGSVIFNSYRFGWITLIFLTILAVFVFLNVNLVDG